MKKLFALFLLTLLPFMASAQTKRTINVKTAGSLSTLISDQEKYTIEQLTLTGEINGDDLGFLREMAGKEKRKDRGSFVTPNEYFSDTDGRLTHLDLSETKIVAGGTSMRISDLDNDFEFTVTRDNELPPRIFDGCKNLVSISIPNSVSSIGSFAFRGTAWLDNWPDGLVYIGKVLYGYKGDMPTNTSITIKDGTIGIACSAFENCSNLVSIKIPNTVINIGGFNGYPHLLYNGAFSGCTGLTSITIPNSLISIGTNTFSGCTSLKTLTIPSSISSYGAFVFSDCSGLVSVTFEDGVTTIGSSILSGCTNLASVIIPNSVTNVGYSAFYGCSSLVDFYCFAKDVPTVGYEPFSSSNIGNAILHVPAECIDVYKTAEPWNQFKEIVAIGEEEKITEDIIKITSAEQTTWCSAYDLDFTDVEGLKAYTAEGYDRETGTIWLMRVKKVPAGEGILLIGDEGEYHVPHKATTCYYGNFMVGTLSAKTINETDGEYTNYYLSNGDYGVGFYKVNGSVDIKANRAYLPLLKNTVSSTRGFIGIDFDDDAEGTTGVDALLDNGEMTNKDIWYNLQGQRVENPSKGLYIRNGKKVLIK